MNKISKLQKCLLQRNGVEIWMDCERAEKLQQILMNITEHKFVNYEGRTINTADCVGIYLPEDIQNMVRGKNGQWKCKGNIWHDRGAACQCVDAETAERIKRREEAIANCTQCQNGWLTTTSGMTPCVCMEALKT